MSREVCRYGEGPGPAGDPHVQRCGSRPGRRRSGQPTRGATRRTERTSTGPSTPCRSCCTSATATGTTGGRRCPGASRSRRREAGDWNGRASCWTGTTGTRRSTWPSCSKRRAAPGAPAGAGRSTRSRTRSGRRKRGRWPGNCCSRRTSRPGSASRRRCRAAGWCPKARRAVIRIERNGTSTWS